GSDGRALVAVGGGDWNILVSSASAGLAEGHAELPAEPAPPRAVQLTLGADGVLVTVTDGRGRPVQGAQLTLDGVSVGSTDVSGNAVVEVARPGQQLLVSHPSIWPEPPVPVDPGQREQLVEVDWIPRSVRVAATHEGSPVSVWVSASGPGKVAPVAIEGSGELVLPPGRWELVASAEGSALGAVRRFAEVPATGDVAPVAFDLQPARVRQTAEGLELVDVKFAVGADMADATFAPVLEEIAATVIADPRIRRVEVQGHTDPTGGPEYNFELSRRRALSIVRALEARGVPPDLLVARGYGPSRPIADNATPEGRALNRRVDFRTVLAE
ncbi:MAG: OmpA family protein, partial [Myxococcales bacterium]|nr:OmpA family protein [Myxococcales bacterium]